MKLNKCQKVSASLADASTNLSIIGAFQIVEDAITEFMGELKIDGITTKKIYNAVWVFTKTKIKFLKNLGWNNKYTLTCFISKISKATIDIDVEVKNIDEEICFYSRTELCALDMDSGRIRKVSTVGVGDSFKFDVPSIDLSFTKIDVEELPIKEQVKVRFTNIDYAVHTNNVEYIRFMLNTFSVSELMDSPINEMEILYVNQSFENDILTIQKESFDSKDIFIIKKEDKIIIKCEILHSNHTDEN